MSAASLKLGKMRGLQRMANESGHFTMVALDQRPPIAQMLAACLGIAPSQVRFEDMLAAKRLLVQVLGPHASAMLLDPNYALPAALACLPARTGLLVTLEDHRFRDTPQGRLSHSIAYWSVEKIKRAGGDGVKVLAWYRPDAAPEVRAHQQAYVREVGEECRRHDIAYVLELLTYPFPGQMPSASPQHVIDSLRETDGTPAHREAQAGFDEMGRICREAGAPWVLLSAGVTPAQFLRVMRYAYAAGAHGFLAGRAIWASALKRYPDLPACEEVLRIEGLQTLHSLVDLTQDAACAWTPDYSGFDHLRAEGDLCAAYA
jgi:tagatose 1,6-diphosphate aldolase